MKKLKLNLDEIKVESFETNSIQSKLGTVVGQSGPDLPEPAETNDCPVSGQATCGTCNPMWCNWPPYQTWYGQWATCYDPACR